MVKQWLGEQDPERTILLDGYPRTVEQAKNLIDVVRENSYDLKIFDFVVQDEVIISRLAHRLVCGNKACQSVYSDLASSLQMPIKKGLCDICSHELVRRADDEPLSVAERLRIYHSHARELEAFFKQAGFAIASINGNVPLSVVYEEFLRLYNHSYV
jgi:adenylate kinase